MISPENVLPFIVENRFAVINGTISITISPRTATIVLNAGASKKTFLFIFSVFNLTSRITSLDPQLTSD
jgi:hypothetical protein